MPRLLRHGWLPLLGCTLLVVPAAQASRLAASTSVLGVPSRSGPAAQREPAQALAPDLVVSQIDASDATRLGLVAPTAGRTVPLIVDVENRGQLSAAIRIRLLEAPAWKYPGGDLPKAGESRSDRIYLNRLGFSEADPGLVDQVRRLHHSESGLQSMTEH